MQATLPHLLIVHGPLLARNCGVSQLAADPSVNKGCSQNKLQELKKPHTLVPSWAQRHDERTSSTIRFGPNECRCGG